MKVIVLIDRKTGKVVKSFSQSQSQFESSQTNTEFPNCEKHLLELTDMTKIAGSTAKTLAEKILEELESWEGVGDSLEEYPQSEKSALVSALGDLIYAGLIRRPAIHQRIKPRQLSQSPKMEQSKQP